MSADDVAVHVAQLRQYTDKPLAVGFGIRDAAGAKAVARFADAVVIGSALVDTLAGATAADVIASRAREFLAPIRTALDTP
jgi:tryptophan synthase alpha chain